MWVAELTLPGVPEAIVGFRDGTVNRLRLCEKDLIDLGKVNALAQNAF